MDNDYEFRVKFHWHLEDIGIRHAYSKPRTPRLAEWEAFYHYHRPHGGLGGKTP
jgi:transposase InsO family protein